MSLRVDPNGTGSGKDTHVSVFMCLMKGVNDNNLQFPMTGIFTVQVLNWKVDSQHFEQPIEFDDSTSVECKEQVVTGERAVGTGIHLISHELLTSDKQYLQDDQLSMRVGYYPLPPQSGNEWVWSE